MKLAGINLPSPARSSKTNNTASSNSSGGGSGSSSGEENNNNGVGSKGSKGTGSGAGDEDVLYDAMIEALFDTEDEQSTLNGTGTTGVAATKKVAKKKPKKKPNPAAIPRPDDMSFPDALRSIAGGQHVDFEPGMPALSLAGGTYNDNMSQMDNMSTVDDVLLGLQITPNRVMKSQAVTATSTTPATGTASAAAASSSPSRSTKKTQLQQKDQQEHSSSHQAQQGTEAQQSALSSSLPPSPNRNTRQFRQLQEQAQNDDDGRIGIRENKNKSSPTLTAPLTFDGGIFSDGSILTTDPELQSIDDGEKSITAPSSPEYYDGVKPSSSNGRKSTSASSSSAPRTAPPLRERCRSVFYIPRKRRRCVFAVLGVLGFLGLAAVILSIVFSNEIGGGGTANSSASTTTGSGSNESPTNSETEQDIDVPPLFGEPIFAAPSPTPSLRTSQPTMSPPPTASPTISAAPTTKGPTGSPTVKPSKAPTPMPTTSAPTTSAPTTASPTPSPTPAPTPAMHPLESLLIANSIMNITSENLYNASSPAGKAFSWMLDRSTRADYKDMSTTKVLQRFSLLSMLFGFIPSATRQANFTQFVLNVDDECEWTGVTCNETGVEKVIWPNMGLTGTIANEVQLLQGNLKRFDIGENSVVGTIPEGLYKLTQLQELYLHQNQLVGSISDDISQLSNLVSFYAGNNALSGTFPAGLGSGRSGAANSKPLRYLSLHMNQIAGTIPSGMNLRSLFYFDVSNNQITGPFPEDWVEGNDPLTRLRHIYMDNNQMTGTLPSNLQSIGNGRLETLLLSNNQFTGTFPGNYEQKRFLQHLEIQNNFFTGMESDVCNLIVYNGGEMVNLRADCEVCVCNWFCGRDQCF